MLDLPALADLGRQSVAALWLPVALWTAVALLAEAGLRLTRTRAALALPVRGSLLAALPVAVSVPALLSLLPAPPVAVARWAPAAQWLPEPPVGDVPTAAAPPLADVLLGLATLAVIAAGAAGLVRLAVSLVRIAGLRRGLAGAGPEGQAAVDQARRRLGVARPVRAVQAPTGAAPFTLGWRRPVVALPRDLDADAREVAALHEVAHVGRGDYAWHLGQRAVAAAFAAHPLVWALGRGLDLGREQAADAAVLNACPGRRRTYADLLFSYASRPAPALALGGARGSSLKHRIDAMTSPLSPARALRVTRWSRLSGLAALVLVASLAVATAQSPAPPPPPEPASTLPVDDIDHIEVRTDGPRPEINVHLKPGRDAEAARRVADDAFDPDDGPGATRLTVHYEGGTIERSVRTKSSARAGSAPSGAAPDTTETFDVAEVQPVLIGGAAAIQPEYPPLARQAGIQGRVIVQFIVDTDGTVTDARAVRSPHEMLSQAALAAVRDLRFEPGRQRGEPVRVRFALPVSFQLPSAEAGEQSGAVPSGDRFWYSGIDVDRLTPSARAAFTNTLRGAEGRLDGYGTPSGEVTVRYIIGSDGEVSNTEYSGGPNDLKLLAAFLLGTARLSEDARPGPGGTWSGEFRLGYRAAD